MTPARKTQGEGKPVIGLVGGVSAGKSAAAAEFAALGCALIDADAIARELIELPEVRDELKRRWGRSILRPDGDVDREALGRIVFDEADELNALNEIMQGRIRTRIEEQIGEARRAGDVQAIVLDAAILFEAGWNELCTHVLFVSAPDELRMRRSEGRGLSTEDWSKREKSQISLDRKAGRCYAVLDNSSSVSYLREQVRRMFCEMVHGADRP